MATVDKHHWYSLDMHRPWEDVTSMILGAVVVISPVIMAPADGVIAISSGLAGVLIVMLGALEFVSLRRWQEYLEVLCGAWLVVAPFALGYAGTLRAVHMAVGLAVIVLGLLEVRQDRVR